MKFPDMIHAFKPSPKTNMQENWGIVDFFSDHPETAGELVKCLLDDEVVTVGGTCHTHATKDLTDSIAAGNY